MNYEIKINNINDLQPLDKFLSDTEKDLKQCEGLVVVSNDDIKHATKLIKTLKEQEVALTKSKELVIKMAKLTVFDVESAKRRTGRLKLNSSVEFAKQKIKDNIITEFTDEAKSAIDKSKASENYKQGINPFEIANNAIKGKSTQLKEALDIELEIIITGLVKDEQLTKEKTKIIKSFDETLTQDTNYLFSLPLEAIKPELENRKLRQDQKIKQEAEKLAQNEAEKLAQNKTADEPKKVFPPLKEVINETAEPVESFVITVGFKANLNQAKEIASSIKIAMETNKLQSTVFLKKE